MTFYKSDWKYLNDAGARGAINARDTATGIRGVMVPAGTSSVYDQQLGKNLKRPFLHVRYRASQLESRKMKNLDHWFSWRCYFRFRCNAS
jgi:hypothetical protein